MYKNVLTGITVSNVQISQIDDSKSESPNKGTIMDFVNKHRNFSRVSIKDLGNVFDVLRSRCPKTWNLQLEDFAKDFNEKINKLRSIDSTCYIDPDTGERASIIQLGEDYSAIDLLAAPELWNMTGKEGRLLRQVLHHFTIFVPMGGRPFVRVWLEALIPCFSRWIFSSHTGDMSIKSNLKHFLSAFAQPGISVCLADKGARALRSLKYSARAAEALARGTVEREYWKCLLQSSFDSKSAWYQLAHLPSEPLQLSQLDVLPDNLHFDGDCVDIFSNIISPEITTHFQSIVQDIIDDSKIDGITNVKPGPPKTLDRSKAKAHEYMTEFHSLKDQRSKLFHRKFWSVFDREPSEPEDFVWNIMDFARCSVTVPSATDLLKVIKLFEKKLTVVCIKNGYSPEHQIKGSGYRDLKILVKVDFDNLKLDGIPIKAGRTAMICEIQLLCEPWFHNKLATSVSYKILRASSMRELLHDFSKYLAPDNETKRAITPKEAVKNGWINMIDGLDFTHIDESKLLLEACQSGWKDASADILVNKLGANLETRDIDGRTPALWCSRRGHSMLLKTLIDLKADLKSTDRFNFTALHHAVKGGHEDSVQALLAAKASCSARDFRQRTPLDIAYNQKFERIQKILKGETVPPINRPKSWRVKQMDILKTATLEGNTADVFETLDLGRSEISEVFNSQIAVVTVENLVQFLWFGAYVNHVNKQGLSPLCYAVKHGTLEAVNLILDAKANVNYQTSRSRFSPLHFAVNFAPLEIASVLLNAKADTELRATRGFTALHMAVKNNNGKMTSLLIKAGANINAKVDDGQDAMSLAENNAVDVDEVTSLIKAAAGQNPSGSLVTYLG